MTAIIAAVCAVLGVLGAIAFYLLSIVFRIGKIVSAIETDQKHNTNLFSKLFKKMESHESRFDEHSTRIAIVETKIEMNGKYAEHD